MNPELVLALIGWTLVAYFALDRMRQKPHSIRDHGIVFGEDDYEPLPMSPPKPLALAVALKWRDRGTLVGLSTDEEVAEWVEKNNRRLAERHSE